VPEPDVELVRRSLDAFARGDFDTAFAAFGESAEWRTAADEPDQETFRGPEGLRAFVRSLTDLWQDRFDGVTQFEDFIVRGDWVIVPWTAHVRGRGSGIPVEIGETYAVLVRGGEIVRVEEYRSTAQAIEAIGQGG